MTGSTGVQRAASPAGRPMSEHFIYALTIALFVYGWLSVNIYLPILPEFENIFRTTTQTAKLTVTIFLLGFALAQLVWGPLSDRFGRRAVLLTGLAISVVGVTLAASTTNIYLFMAARFLESIGIGVCPVMARSVLTDTLDKAHVAIAMAYNAAVVALVPAFAPIVGGYLNLLFSWRSVFFFVALCGLGLWLLSRSRLPETAKDTGAPLKALQVAHNYIDMLKNSLYFGYIFIYCIAYGSWIGYYVSAPYIFIDGLGYQAHEYGYFLLFNAVCYIIGALVSRFAIPQAGTALPLRLSLIAYVLSVILLVVFEFSSRMSAITVLIPMSVYVFGSGLVSPASNSAALAIFKGRAGASAAVIGCSITIGGAISTGILSHFHITRLWQLALYVGICTLINLAAYLTFLRRPA
jgi:DHA1 family bicyclomycin/chloramphenicol resistance-like MFS transporter